MTFLTTPTAKELLGILFGAGLRVATPGAAPANVEISERPGPDGQACVVLKPDPEHGAERVLQVLGQAGYAVQTQIDGEIYVIGRAAVAHRGELVMAFTIPVRLPTLNPQLRMHWYRKSKAIKALCWDVFAAIPANQRPRQPLEHIVIEIDRYNTNEPDQENLQASGKWLLDVLQPLHPTARPYGLGVIREDASWCLHDTLIRHVPSRTKRTDVRIYRAKKA